MRNKNKGPYMWVIENPAWFDAATGLGEPESVEFLAEPREGAFPLYRHPATKEIGLLEACKEIYRWMNQLPVPTTGCTAKMQILHDAIAKAEREDDA